MANKNEEKGAKLRREGKPKPARKETGFFTTEAEVRARDDQRIGWERENKKRSAQSRKKS